MLIGPRDMWALSPERSTIPHGWSPANLVPWTAKLARVPRSPATARPVESVPWSWRPETVIASAKLDARCPAVSPGLSIGVIIHAHVDAVLAEPEGASVRLEHVGAE